MKLAAMEGLYHGGYNADMVAIGIVNPDKKPGDQQKEFTAVVKVPAVLSILANRKIGSFVPGIDDLVFGNRKQGIISAAEKIESGKKAIASLATYKNARKKGSDGVASQALKSFRENQQYIGYGYFEKAEDLVPNVPLVFYSFHIMVALGTLFPIIFIIFLLVIYGVATTRFQNSYKGIWPAGLGVVLVVLAILFTAGYHNTAFYPSKYDLQSSLTIANASSSHYTLTAMSYIAISIPFILAYVMYVWHLLDARKLTEDDISTEKY